ncbi:MAG: tRNA epoxyqueuosine(34) reductase QueG [Alphaproteobacteria bacterium]|nr:tRNA epoxyqueuosine(34) reductase QueG [Alphaproteobacteria bacterium]
MPEARLRKSTPDAREAIRSRALAAGFDAVGFARADSAIAAGEKLRAFLAAGRHGDMAWMEQRTEWRADPTALWPDARTVIVCALNYGGTADDLDPSHGVLASYARGRDYHELLKGKLKFVADFIYGKLGADVKVFTDTAPVMEKPLATAAGLGWQGKHTNLVSREFGSWLLLGEIFTTLDLGADAAETDACGTCARCLEVCPTAAFPAPYQLDARRCISYLTIEHAGHIAEEFRVPMGNRIFGCDDCLAVCPWNKYAQAARETKLLPRQGTTAPALAELAALDEAGFRTRFATTPIKRSRRDRFVRNVLIAIGNSGDRSLIEIVCARLDDSSPLVRAMAAWALFRLDRAAFDSVRAQQLAHEVDEGVRAEWMRGA